MYQSLLIGRNDAEDDDKGQCRTHGWIISLPIVRHVSRGAMTRRMTTSGQCRTHVRVMSLTWMSRVAQNSKSCYKRVSVVSQWGQWRGRWQRVNGVARMNGSRHSHELVSRPHQWVMSLTSVSYGSHTNESCCQHQWAMSLIWMSHGTHMHESCLIEGNDAGDNEE